MSPAFGVFVFASLILAITPEPGVIFLVTRTWADALGPRFIKFLGWRSCGRYVTAATFIALGVYTAFGGPNRTNAGGRGH